MIEWLLLLGGTAARLDRGWATQQTTFSNATPAKAVPLRALRLAFLPRKGRKCDDA